MTQRDDAATVSVIIAAYNAERYLDEAIKSVLGQTYANVEVLVVDDGSNDSTAAIAERAASADGRVRLLRPPHQGLSAARNVGLGAARGSYICFLDADDLFLPDKLQRQVSFLEEHPALALVFSDVYEVDEHLKPLLLRVLGDPPVPFADLYIYRNWFVPIAPLLRARVATAVGPFDVDLRAAEDWDYWTRCARVGAFGYLPGPVALYRNHPGQMHRQFGLMRQAQMHLIKKHYGSDPARYRRALGARYWDYAKLFRYNRRHWQMVYALARFTFTVRNYQAMRLIMRLI